MYTKLPFSDIFLLVSFEVSFFAHQIISTLSAFVKIVPEIDV